MFRLEVALHPLAIRLTIPAICWAAWVFSSPVYPGETIRTEIWKDGNEISFRARVEERGVVILNNGMAIIE